MCPSPVPTARRLPIFRSRQWGHPLALSRALDERVEAALARGFLLRAHDPPSGCAAVPGRLAFPVDPGRRVRVELGLVGGIEGHGIGLLEGGEAGALGSGAV